MSWVPYIEDPEDLEPTMSALLPSSLKDVWGDALPAADPPPSRLPPRVGSAAPARPSPVSDNLLYSVHFHPNRRETLASSVHFDDGVFVITDADRGIDIGRIIAQTGRPQFRELKNVKSIIRRATDAEIAAIPGKEERERAALMLCQAKVRELAFPMEITGAEFQFDGKKLTFYYSASKYIDFRNLVKALFKIFGIRIWMVWYDGNAPVKDVYSRGISQ
jgi:hypothetical protein